MLAMMLIAQITVISGAPRPSSEEAARMLGATRSPANLTDVVFVDAADVPTRVARSTWKPGDGPFGSFDNRITHSGVARRSRTLLRFPRYNSDVVRPPRRMYTGGRRLFRPSIPRAQRVRLTVNARPTLTRSH
jgi:hypothetical protein